MAIVKRMSSKASVKKIEKYLKQEEKTEEKLISGMNCDSDNFARECQSTNLLYDKNNQAGERKYYHVIQSFSPEEGTKLTPELAHRIAKEFAEKNFKGHEVLVVTHLDKEHMHNHFVVNSVSFETGNKYRADNKSLWELRRTSNELCRENGLIHSIQDLDKRAKDKFTDGEFRKELKGEEVWKTTLRNQIKDTMDNSKSLDDFRQQLKEKYNVETQVRTKTSKGKSSEIIEYKPEGNRKFMDGEKRLGTEYGKEYIDGITRRNAEKTRDEITRDTNPKAGTTSGIDTGKLDAEIRNQQLARANIVAESRMRELAKLQEAERQSSERQRQSKEKIRKRDERER